ncbi:MAG: hypothetical protein M1825_004050 [Sarcosagium campestre]|nr:MAG: hypothetical protein M1825_004050 [Sarcosagium campestre]
MSDDSRGKDRHGFLKKHNWKGKLFSNDQVNARDAVRRVEQDTNVNDFLSSGSSQPAPRSLPLQPPPSSPPKLGRIDTASATRWPTATEINQFGRNLQDSSPRTEDRPSYTSKGTPLSPTLSRRPRNRGLTVTFSDEKPDIIGEGGDEAETPASQVLQYRTRSHSPQRAPATNWTAAPLPSHSLSLRVGRHAAPARETASRDGSAGGFDWEPKPVKRRATTAEQGLGHSEGWTPSLSAARNLDTSPARKAVPGDSASIRTESGDSTSFAKRVQAKMRAEGQAHYRASRNLEPLKDFGFHPETPQEDDPPAYNSAGTPHISTPTWAPPSPNYSLRPSPSPQASSREFFPPSETPSRSSFEKDTLSGPPQSASNLMPSSSDVQSGSSTSGVGAGSRSSDAIEEFSTRTQYLGRIFQLSAESAKPIPETPLAEWIRAGTWWFIKGRSELEMVIRGAHSAQTPRTSPSLQTAQAHENIAKIWWILQYIVPQHPETRRYGNGSIGSLIDAARSAGDEETAMLLETHQILLAKMQALATSMKRNNLLPPRADEGLLAQGLDSVIWISYPFFTPDVSSILSGSWTKSLVSETSRTKSVTDAMPLGDTNEHFNPGRMFVDVYLTDEENESQHFQLPCLLSIIRDCTDWQIKVVIASQNSLVNVCIQPGRGPGPSWDSVRWISRYNKLVVKLPRGFTIDVEMKERDFKTLKGLFDQALKIETSLQPEPNEEMLFENTVRSFQCKETPHSDSPFSRDPLPRCRVRLFEKRITISEGTGSRKAHRGFRIVVVTSPRVKTLGCIVRDIGGQAAIEVGFLRGKDGSSALFIKSRHDGKITSMIMTFHQDSERTRLLDLLNGVILGSEETVFADISLKTLSISARSGAQRSGSTGDVLASFRWQRLRAINKDPHNPDHDFGQTVLSENLRLAAESAIGTLTDRINLGPGQLQIRLGAGSSPELKVLRIPQDDLTISVAEGQVSPDVPDALNELLRVASTSETVRKFGFHTLKGSPYIQGLGQLLLLMMVQLDLHRFEAALTGFSVLFDGVASNFAISRRRMVVPISKKWETSYARIQVLRQDKVFQLVAFFENFKNGECMNFQLKGTDFYELTGKSGKHHAIRFVDAKFALPKSEESDSKEFVCLDMPEYPGEHDDILIAFDQEQGKRNANAQGDLESDADETATDLANFQAALPAAVGKVSRITSFRK